MRVKAGGTKRVVNADDVPRRETKYERSQNERDGSQRFSGSIVVFNFFLDHLLLQARCVVVYARLAAPPKYPVCHLVKTETETSAFGVG
jgi:hypothetical protein